MNAVVRNERAGDGDAIEALYLRAFGAGRFAKTAERLREGHQPEFALSFVACLRERVLGAVRLWRVRAQEGGELLFLGPITVEAEWRKEGYGAQLVTRCLDAAREAGWGAVCLVGDMGYFGAFGFTPVRPGTILMPGPVDPARFLILELVEGASAALAGQLSAPRDATPTSGDPERQAFPADRAAMAATGSK
jgi:predicted N-acetyltransferase YhbS